MSKADEYLASRKKKKEETTVNDTVNAYLYHRNVNKSAELKKELPKRLEEFKKDSSRDLATNRKNANNAKTKFGTESDEYRRQVNIDRLLSAEKGRRLQTDLDFFKGTVSDLEKQGETDYLKKADYETVQTYGQGNVDRLMKYIDDVNTNYKGLSKYANQVDEVNGQFASEEEYQKAVAQSQMTPEQIEEEKQKEWDEKNFLEKAGSFLKENAAAGVLGAENAITSTIGLPGTVQKAITGKDNFVSKWVENSTRGKEEQQMEAEEVNQVAGKVPGAIGKYAVQGTIQAIPNALLALGTGGANIGSQAAAKLGTSLASAKTTQLLTNGVKTLASNPLYWSSVAQTLGTTYDEAVKEGASTVEALLTSFVSSFAGAAVEIGGGLETIPSSPAGVKTWLKGMLEEGREEPIQGIITQLTKKAVYDQEKELFSMDNQDAVVNPARMGEEFIGGATVGAILGGAQQGGVNALNKYYQNTGISKQIKEIDGGVEGLVESGLESAQETKSYQFASKVNEKLNQGKEVSPNDITKLRQYNEKAILKEGDLNAQNQPLNEQPNNSRVSEAEGQNVTIQQAQTGFTIKDIDTVEGISESDAIIRTKDGKAAKLSTTTFRDPVSQMLVNAAVKSYDNKTATSFVKGYDKSIPSDTYAKGFDKAYVLGKNGDFTLEQAMPKLAEYTSVIPSNILAEAYYHGVTKGAEKTSVNMSPEQIASVDVWAKATGRKVIYHDTLNGANGILRNGQIEISRTSDNPAMTVFAHEVTHDIKIKAPEAYKKYETVVIDYFESYHPEEYTRLKDGLKKLYKTENEADIKEEIVANASETFLMDKKTVKQFAESNPTEAKTILSVIKDVIQKLKNTLKDLSPKSREAKMLNEDLDFYEEARRLWTDALIVSTKTETKSDTLKKAETPIKSSIKNIAGDAKSERDVIPFRYPNGTYVEIIKNPTDSDYRKLGQESKKEFGESLVRTTYDENDNRYIWKAYSSVHAPIENFLMRTTGLKVHQGKLFDLVEIPARFSLKDSEDNTLTPEQIEFFKDSQVRDKSGNLKVVYHGSGTEFYVFDAKMTGLGNDQYGNGFSFTTDKEVADGYRSATLPGESNKLGGSDKPTTISAYLNIKNPLIVDGMTLMDADVDITQDQAYKIMKYSPVIYDIDETPLWDWEDISGLKKIPERLIKDVAQNYTGSSLLPLEGDFFRGNAGAFRKAVRDVLGYDGVVHTFDSGEQHYVAWFGNQIKETTNLNPTDSEDIRYSLKYSEGNNLTEAQAEFFKDSRLRDENGNLLKLYHGSPVADIAAFSKEYAGTHSNAKEGFIFLSDSKKFAEDFAYEFREKDNTSYMVEKGKKGKVYELYANAKKPLDLGSITKKQARMIYDMADDKALTIDEIYELSKTFGGRKVIKTMLDAETLYEKGYDAIINDLSDGTKEVGVYAPEQIKETSNLKPTESDDIKKSLKDSEGNDLTTEQAEFFKDSKVRDDEGDLLVVYHGTGPKNFTIFDSDKETYHGRGGVIKGTWLTDSIENAKKFIYDKGNLMTLYVNAKNPLIMDYEDANSIKSIIFNEYSSSLMDIEEWDAYAEDEDDLLQRFDTEEFQDAINNGIEGIMENASDNGNPYDAVIMKNFRDILPSTQIVVFDSNQIKEITNLTPTESEDIRYSLKDTGDIYSDSWDAMMSEYDATSILEEGAQAIKNLKLDEMAIARISRNVIREYKSGYGVDVLTDNLKKVFAYISDAEHVDWNDMTRIMAEVAKPVIEQSNKLDTTFSAQYDEFRNYVRKLPIRLDETQKEEVASAYGTYNDFRKANFGRLNLTEKGEDLDSIWSQLADQAGGFLNADTNSTEQVFELLNALEDMKPKLANLSGDKMRYENDDSAAYDLALKIYEDYLGSVTDIKVKKEVEAVKKKLNAKISQIRKEKNDKYDAIYKDLRQKNKELRDKKNERIAQIKAAHVESNIERRRKAREKDAIKKYKTRINKNSKELYSWLSAPTDEKHVPEMLKKATVSFLSEIDFTTGRDSKANDVWRLRAAELKSMLEAIENEQVITSGDKETGFFLDFDEDFMPTFNAFFLQTQKIGNVHDLTVEDLKNLDYLMTVLKATIQQVNRFIGQKNFETVQAMGNKTFEEWDGKKEKQPTYLKGWDAILNVDMLEPTTYFEVLGKTPSTIMKALTDGFDKRTELIKQARGYMDEITRGLNTDDWSGNGAKIHTFKIRGREVKMTTAQIMELYVLNKRDQAKGHIYNGGIVVTDIKQSIPKKDIVQNREVKLKESDVDDIVSVLTKEQKRVADNMQRFLSEEGSEWGNEVSMQRFGIKKFTEKNYYPIKVDKDSVQTNDKNISQAALYKIRNLGMTKATVKGASNALYVGDIFDTFTGHIADMSNYNAFTIPLTDAMKWFNYKETEISKTDRKTYSVKKEMRIVFGENFQKYFVNLMLDINGEVDMDTAFTGFEKWLSRFKTAKVGLNSRVIVQQPTAIMRAGSVMDYKYLAKAMTGKPAIAEVQQKVPIATWKAWGFYDAMIGRSLKEVIVGKQTLGENLKDKSMYLAQKADNITWGYLYSAVKLEIAETTDFKEGTAEFDKAAKERFTDIVYRTQVVDSVLTRSQAMRSKNGMWKYETMFFSEPTKGYNMLYRDLYTAKTSKSKKAVQKAFRTAYVWSMSQVTVSAFSAVIDAMRDDDEYQSWLEKYIDAFRENVIHNIAPWNVIPIAKDFATAIEGYALERSDMEILNAIAKVGKQMQNKEFTTYKAIYNFADMVALGTGVPIGNAVREVKTLYNNTVSELTGIKIGKSNTGTTIKYEYLLNALQTGDTEGYNRTIKDLQTDGKDDKAIRTGIKTYITNTYKEVYSNGSAEDKAEIEAMMKGIVIEGERLYDDLDKRLKDWMSE